MSIVDAADASSVSRSFLYLKIKDGTLPTIKVGGRRLILRTDLESYFESFRKEAA
ncbi:helix-turn-helix domain-containing protein [Phenylobacterium sp.]|uniref:helix-turn-helix domain-containing protein n=1 Tax=Phenylobacterium sp. TaxID=1871053 RepID=UPI003BA848A7